jgi:hypothetical protein
MPPTTVTALRTLGFVCTNRAPKGCSGYWLIQAPSGREYEVDMDEDRRWLASWDDGRFSSDTDRFGDALTIVYLVEQNRANP